MDKDCKKVETICLDNNRTRLIISNLTGLIDLSVKDESRRNKWERSIVQDYCAAMVMARRKEDFTPQVVLDFQLWVDLFFQTWVELHGRDGIKNYIHMLASGHFAEYLSYWGSLYAHSQQGTYYYIFYYLSTYTTYNEPTHAFIGWEHLNSLNKTFYFRRTQRGGAVNVGRYKQSRLLPIAKWLLRRSMWATGTSFADMELEVMQRRQLLLVKGGDETVRPRMFGDAETLGEGGDGSESDDSDDDDELVW